MTKLKDYLKSNFFVLFFMISIGFIIGCESMIYFKEATTVYADGKDVGYRAGQIDYANGRIAYELKKQYDGSTQWEKKDIPLEKK